LQSLHTANDILLLRSHPLYHPASVIYNASLKATYAQDLQTLAEMLRAGSIPETDI
jgi:uracil-DNA glycosylase